MTLKMFYGLYWGGAGAVVYAYGAYKYNREIGLEPKLPAKQFPKEISL